MDNDSNKITWISVIVACVALIGIFVVNTLFPTQIKNVETYINTVIINVTNTDTLNDINNSSNAGFTYTILNDDTKTMSITGYTGNNINISIPANVNYNGHKYIVTNIDNKAFYNLKLVAVYIPNTIVSIGYDAFADNDLTSIIIPNSVKSMGTSVFNHNKLNNVQLSTGLTFINDYVFEYNRLTKIDIPNSITTLGKDSFGHNQLTTLSIPTSITTINDDAFEYNQLESLTIPKSVINIGLYAFATNTLTTVNVPTALQSQILNNFVFSNNSVNVVPSYY